MDLSGIVTAIEDLFYDFVAWIALYPKTLLKTYFRPAWTQQYVSGEWQKPQPERFRDYLNPLIFWLLSMILFIWSSSTENIAISLEGFVLMMVLFAILPAIMACLMLAAQGVPLTHDHLRRPMYTQMLLFGAAQTLFALDMAVSAPMLQLAADTTDLLRMLAALLVFLLWFAVLAAVFLWIPIAEARVFMKELNRPFGRVIGWVLLGMLMCGLLIASMPLLSSEIDMVAGMMQFSQ
jgi:hypothetical protein